MENKIIQIRDLLNYHNIDNSFKDKIACIKMTPDLVNIGTAPASYMDMFSFVVVLDGCVSFEINYRDIKLEKGDMLLIFPSLLVRLAEQSEDFKGLHLLCERYLFEHQLSTRPAYQQFSLFFRTRYPVIHLSDCQLNDITQSMEQIRQQINRPCAYQEDILLHLLHACFLQILVLIEEKDGDKSAKLNHAEAIFQQFVGLMTAHYKREHQIGFYADKLCMSTTYLSRIIRKVTGKTVNDFLSGLLYSEACQMLVYTDMTINAIADELRFADQSSFGKFFKTKSGVSPLNYRSQWKLAGDESVG